MSRRHADTPTLQLVRALSKRIQEELVANVVQGALEVETLLRAAFHSLIYEPLRVVLVMKEISVYTNLSIPYNRASKKLLSIIHELLRRHYASKNNSDENSIFNTCVGLQGYTLTYDRFRYNAVLDQHVSRIKLITQIIRSLLKIGGGIYRQQTMELIKIHLGCALAELPENHPLERKLKKMMEKL